jgi:hypothetical protein
MMRLLATPVWSAFAPQLLLARGRVSSENCAAFGLVLGRYPAVSPRHYPGLSCRSQL